MIEGWYTPDEQQTAHLIHTSAGPEEPEFNYIVSLIRPDRDVYHSEEIVAAFATRAEASDYLMGIGYEYVGPTAPF